MSPPLMAATSVGAAPVAPPRVAVVIPCHNEEAAVGKVVREFRAALPDARVYVYDNASTDRTSAVAAEAGAIVRSEPLKGKGNVVRRMFADVDADIFVLVDGDATYDAASAPRLVQLLREGPLDMVTGVRVYDSPEGERLGHRFGNRALTGLVALIFGSGLQDMLSGFRVLSRRYVKSFPALAKGFEIETELTVHALELRMPIAEAPTPYGARPEGSSSKLNTFRDGFRILGTILKLVREERPLMFFGVIASAAAAFSLVLAYPVFATFVQTHQVPQLPTAVLAAVTMLASFLSLACGLILDTVTRGRHELKRMQYLALRAPDAP